MANGEILSQDDKATIMEVLDIVIDAICKEQLYICDQNVSKSDVIEKLIGILAKMGMITSLTEALLTKK